MEIDVGGQEHDQMDSVETVEVVASGDDLPVGGGLLDHQHMVMTNSEGILVSSSEVSSRASVLRWQRGFFLCVFLCLYLFYNFSPLSFLSFFSWLHCCLSLPLGANCINPSGVRTRKLHLFLVRNGCGYNSSGTSHFTYSAAGV